MGTELKMSLVINGCAFVAVELFQIKAFLCMWYLKTYPSIQCSNFVMMYIDVIYCLCQFISIKNH